MTPDEGVPRPAETGPTRARRETWFGDGPIRRWLSRWGFTLFVVLVLVLGRSVLLPFIFGALIAYILAPVVGWMSQRKGGHGRRMPRALAIVICYIVFIAAVVGFMFLLVPRLSSDVARLGKRAPELYKRIDQDYVPEIAHWLERRFPSLAVVKDTSEAQPVSSDVPLPPGTAATVTPLPDGRFALGLTPNGIDIKPTPDGGFHLQPLEQRPEALTLEDKLRSYAGKMLVGLQSRLNDVARVFQDVIAGFIRGIFGFFFTLMIGAFILIDVDKVHAFLRSVLPSNFREDYDVIIEGIDQGLSGVIRGQLVICVINAVLTYIGLLVFGVNYKLIFAIVAGLMSLIPIFGSILSSVPIVLVALASGDQGVDVLRGVAILLWIIGIHLIEANVLNPKIIGTAAKIHPVLVIFALFFGEASYGLAGALLAVPLLSAIQVVFLYLYRKRWKDAARSGPIAKPPTDPGLLPPTRS
ncbi:MAG TPA: AI-2E family transporter [Kofleriaceae bacterium]|nr:AI-2E family transporter [Kofleriaceae bacterium]